MDSINSVVVKQAVYVQADFNLAGLVAALGGGLTRAMMLAGFEYQDIRTTQLAKRFSIYLMYDCVLTPELTAEEMIEFHVLQGASGYVLQDAFRTSNLRVSGVVPNVAMKEPLIEDASFTDIAQGAKGQVFSALSGYYMDLGADAPHDAALALLEHWRLPSVLARPVAR